MQGECNQACLNCWAAADDVNKRHCKITQALPPTNNPHHKTLPLMGATRLASGIVQLLSSGGGVLFIFPRRVALIRGSVRCFWSFIDIIGCGSANQASLIAFALHGDSGRTRLNDQGYVSESNWFDKRLTFRDKKIRSPHTKGLWSYRMQTFEVKQ